tara:strand:+ start:329 stop:1231 length:903 start_codon:yes stop_codon:yes gene_type:complete
MSKKILDLGDEYDAKSYNFFMVFFTKILNGFYIYRTRKASVHAGASTFFAIMSFFPMVLLLVSATGYFLGDLEAAKKLVLNNLDSSFPKLAPWIFKSIEKIVTSQLKGFSQNILNIIFLAWSSAGFYNSVLVGIRSIIHQEIRGGFIFDDIRSLLGCTMMTAFIVCLLGFSEGSFIYNIVIEKNKGMHSVIKFLFEYNVFQLLISLFFFTFCYKFMESISIKDSFWGALTFVICFIVAKSFYGVYIGTIGKNLQESFGNFYTLVIGLIWIYVLMGAFFLGACVAYTNKSRSLPNDFIEEK